MKRQRIIVGLLLILGLLAGVTDVWALKNACGKCGKQSQLADLVCKDCANPLNLCLACGTQNPVANDYCSRCGEMLAEMRVLATIDPEVRDELRLGQSDRAQLERELAKIDNQLVKEPEKAEAILYRQAKIFKRMNFFAKEAKAWGEYLEKFPNTSRKSRIKAFESEALRQWGYLFYEQKEMPAALAKFEEAVKANPLNAEAWQWIGRLKNETKDPKGAADAYLASLRAKPGDKTAIHFLRLLKQPIPKDLLKPVAAAIQVEEALSEKPVESASKSVPAAPVAVLASTSTTSTSSSSSSTTTPATPAPAPATPAPPATAPATTAPTSTSTSTPAPATASASAPAPAPVLASVTAVPLPTPVVIPVVSPAVDPLAVASEGAPIASEASPGQPVPVGPPPMAPVKLSPDYPAVAASQSAPVEPSLSSEPQKVLIPSEPDTTGPGNASEAPAQAE